MSAARRRGRALSRSFYARDSRAVAPELLGKLVVHDDPEAGRIAVRLVEVEAYAGSEDPGSHGYRGPTARNVTMFGAPGHLYVYFTYGMHWCANVVCGRAGWASAVLLRGGAPVEGIDTIRARRPAARRDRDLCSGPARLAQALGLTRAHDGIDLARGPLRILDDGIPPSARPAVSTRIGLAAGKGQEHPWRWYVPDDPNVSRARAAAR
ncbi:MAG TPA: DNA-3-methyladenine glycosylase [Acidimicrobiia bacterium]|nr:DNA-3-methyladenine glycosylase [Acidimicrobiia bacterium]